MYNCLNTGNEMEKINQMEYKWYVVKRDKQSMLSKNFKKEFIDY